MVEASVLRSGLKSAVFSALSVGVMQAWQEHGFAFEWAKEAGLDVRGLRFARDVRRQLDGITGPSGSHLLGTPTSPQSTGQNPLSPPLPPWPQDLPAHPLRRTARGPPCFPAPPPCPGPTVAPT